MPAIVNTISAFKLIYFRIAIYFLVPSATVFLSQTETWSQQEWNDTGSFLKGRLLIACMVAGFTAVAGYIDSSLHRAKADFKVDEIKRKETETNTAFLTRANAEKDKPKIEL